MAIIDRRTKIRFIKKKRCNTANRASITFYIVVGGNVIKQQDIIEAMKGLGEDDKKEILKYINWYKDLKKKVVHELETMRHEAMEK